MKKFYCDKRKAQLQGRVAEQERVYDSEEKREFWTSLRFVRKEEIDGKVYKVCSQLTNNAPSVGGASNPHHFLSPVSRSGLHSVATYFYARRESGTIIERQEVCHEKLY